MKRLIPPSERSLPFTKWFAAIIHFALGIKLILSLPLKESEIDKNATIKVEYMPMHDELRIYYDTLLVTFDQGEAMNAVMAYLQKFVRDNKYYQYKYMEADKTKPYKDERKQKRMVYSSHIKLIR